MTMMDEWDVRRAELIYMDRLAEAEKERLIRLIPRPPRPPSALRVRCGQLLVRLGERLAGMATPHTHESQPLRESEGTA